MITLEQAFQEGKHILTEAGIEEAMLDAWYLMEYCFLINRASYYMNTKAEVEDAKYQMYLACIEKRSKRIPLSHITNSRDFYGYTFFVNENVLIPRQETEVLVEEALKVCKGKRVLDLCTGSGCIIISLAKEGNLKEAVGVDISKQALEVATKNAVDLEAEVLFLHSDLFEQVEGTFDVIISNPPYIPTLEIEELMPEVRLHEPMLALDGTADGLAFYRKIINEAKRYLNKGGSVLFEIGHDQGDAVKNLFLEAEFEDVTVIQDLTGRDRVVTARY